MSVVNKKLINVTIFRLNLFDFPCIFFHVFLQKLASLITATYMEVIKELEVVRCFQKFASGKGVVLEYSYSLLSFEVRIRLLLNCVNF